MHYEHYFFSEESGFEFPTHAVMRGCATGYSDIGECLYTIKRIEPGDFRSWIDEFTRLADRTLATAEQAEARGHRVSARDAYRRACNYYGATYREYLAFDGWDEFRAAFAKHRDCWARACALSDPVIERRSVPVDGHRFDAWFFPAPNATGPRPTMLYFSGADAVITETAPHVAAAAERGYHIVAVEGPGQGTTLMDLGVNFRPDWEHVVPPTLDEITGWEEIDSDRIFLYGTSQGGYFCLRGACGESRLRGVILDPPVHDVSTVFALTMERMQEAADDAGSTLEETLEAAKDISPALRQLLNWRPFGYGDGAADVATLMDRYAVDQERLATLEAPLLLLDPTGEHFWPGQGTELAKMVDVPVEHVVFTPEMGADSHCQLLAPNVVGPIMFDWMDERLAEADRQGAA